MKYKVIFLYLTLNLITICVYAQKVSNVNAEQLGQSIRISYDLESDFPCFASVYYSVDNGATWQGPLNKVSGDVGINIYSGLRSINWDVLKEVEFLKASSLKFKVDVSLMMLKEIAIGNQVWSSSNLDVSVFSNGDPIPEINSEADWQKNGLLGKSAYCVYEKSNPDLLPYGKLYNWYAVNDSRGLCPTGWRVPSSSDWETLIKYLGGKDNAGYKLKSDNGWRNDGQGDNILMFNGLPGGSRTSYGIPKGLGFHGYFWTTTISNNNDAIGYFIRYYDRSINMGIGSMTFGYSVRCIKN